MSSSAAQPLVMERRRFLRFPARVRVAYDLRGSWAISGTQDLSQGGMALVSGLGTGLEAGAQATFLLHLPDGDRPQPALGDILTIAQDVTRVRFASGQRELIERVRRFAEIIVVPTLESSLSDAVHDRNRLVALAGLYHELGRDTQALDLYHAALDLGASNRDFLEAVAPAMLQQVRPFGPRGATLLAQLRSAVATALTESPSPTLEAVARSLDSSQLVATPQGIEVAPAMPEHEITALRESIRRNREALYKGFLQLLEERNRLRRLEQSTPATPTGVPAPPGTPGENDVVPLLASIRSQLESLNDKPAGAPGAASPAAGASMASAPAARTPTAAPTLAGAPTAVPTLPGARAATPIPAGAPASPAVVVTGPPPRARAIMAPPVEPAAEPPARRRLSTVVGLVVGVLLLGGIGVALWVTRLSPAEVDSARRAAATRAETRREPPGETKRAGEPATGASPATEPAAGGSPATTLPAASSPATAAPASLSKPATEPPPAAAPARTSRPERTGRGRASAAREARESAALPPAPPPPPPPSEALAGDTGRAPQATTHVELALRHLKERKVTLAVQEARAGLADDPSNATAYRILGIAYGMLGQESQSLAAFERFLELAPNDPAAERVRATLRKHKGSGAAR